MELRHLRTGTGVSDHEKVEVRSRLDLRSWLEAHHGQSESIWLVHYRKCSEHHLAYDEIVEEAICWGWIDSLPRALDEQRTMHRLSPRSIGSNWSARNKRIAERAIDRAIMQPAGFQAISLAKDNGSWNALDKIEADELPSDLENMLNSRKNAKANFKRFPKSIRCGILEWIDSAKSQKTRYSRLRKTADMAARNERANQYDRIGTSDNFLERSARSRAAPGRSSTMRK